MKELVTLPTATAQWYELVNEAENVAACRLVEELESYLVFLLMRFSRQPDLAASMLALDYLNGVLTAGSLQQERLRDVGDHCLLYSGLFPHQAERRHVRISYFVDMGRNAYQQLSHTLANTSADLYAHLSQDFISLMDVLLAVRKLGSAGPCLDPLPAYELWADTGSRVAYSTLREGSSGYPVILQKESQIKH